MTSLIPPRIGRIPASSVIPPTTGNTLQASMSGPMCRHADDMKLWMQAVLAGKPWESDPMVMRMPWRSDATLPRRKLRIGTMQHDGLAVPITPVRRAMHQICEKLQDHVTLVDLTDKTGDLWARNWDLIREIYYPDGGEFTRALAKLGNEEILPLTEHILSPPFVRNRTAHEIWELTMRRDAIKKEYLCWWKEQGVDFILSPACITTAPRPGTIKYWGYTSAYNLFDVPAVVFPTALVTDSEMDTSFEREYPVKLLSKWDREARDEYGMHRSTLDGTPIGLQLIGSRFEEVRKRTVSCAAAYRKLNAPARPATHIRRSCSLPWTNSASICKHTTRTTVSTLVLIFHFAARKHMLL